MKSTLEIRDSEHQDRWLHVRKEVLRWVFGLALWLALIVLMIYMYNS